LANDRKVRKDGRTVDALASAADEGRGHAAKCPGEMLAICDPGISEWGNPPEVMLGHRVSARGAPGELKHLSTPRKRDDSLSSGERTERSPNLYGVSRLPPLSYGGWTESWEGSAGPSLYGYDAAETCWNGVPKRVRDP